MCMKAELKFMNEIFIIENMTDIENYTKIESFVMNEISKIEYLMDDE